MLSVFPGSAVWDDAALVVPVPAPTHVEPHVARVTMHPRLLAAAREVLVVTTGASKAANLGRAWSGDDVRELPVRATRLPERDLAPGRGRRRGAAARAELAATAGHGRPVPGRPDAVRHLARRHADRRVLGGRRARRCCSSTGRPPITGPGGWSRPSSRRGSPSTRSTAAGAATRVTDRRGPYSIAREFEDVAAVVRGDRRGTRRARSTSSATRSADGSRSARAC